MGVKIRESFHYTSSPSPCGSGFPCGPPYLPARVTTSRCLSSLATLHLQVKLKIRWVHVPPHRPGSLGAPHSQRATYFPEGHITASVQRITLSDAIRIAVVKYLKDHGFDWREEKRER
jgi:hypothetical protein